MSLISLLDQSPHQSISWKCHLSSTETHLGHVREHREGGPHPPQHLHQLLLYFMSCFFWGLIWGWVSLVVTMIRYMAMYTTRLTLT